MAIPYADKQAKNEELQTLKLMVDLRYLVESLGFEISRDNDKEIRAACIIHGGDNKSAFRVNKTKRTWTCFTHGCQEDHKNDIMGMIMGSLNVDFAAAVKFLGELVGDVSSYKKNLLEDRVKRERESFIRQYKGTTATSCVSEDNLKKYKALRSTRFIKDGFDPSTLDYFEVAGGYTDKEGVVRDIIPIRDDQNNLVAYSLRDIRDNLVGEAKDYKYRLTPGFDKDSVLYNLNNALLFGNKFPIIVVEGFKSVWKFYEYGIYNVVAVMGTTITSGQKRLLKVYALNGIVIMFDGDDPGRKGAEKTLEFMSGELNTDVVSIKEEGLDPSELTCEQVYGYINDFIR